MTTTTTDWFKDVLLDRGYLARLKGDSIKVYLALMERCGGELGRPAAVSQADLARRTKLSAPTILDALKKLQALGLVSASDRPPGRPAVFALADPPDGR